MINITYNENLHLNKNAEILNKVQFNFNIRFILYRTKGALRFNDCDYITKKYEDKINPYRHRKFHDYDYMTDNV